MPGRNELHEDRHRLVLGDHRALVGRRDDPRQLGQHRLGLQRSDRLDRLQGTPDVSVVPAAEQRQERLCMRRHQLGPPLPEFVQHLDGVVGHGGRARGERPGQLGHGVGIRLCRQRLRQLDIGLLVVSTERRSEKRQYIRFIFLHRLLRRVSMINLNIGDSAVVKYVLASLATLVVLSSPAYSGSSLDEIRKSFFCMGALTPASMADNPKVSKRFVPLVKAWMEHGKKLMIASGYDAEEQKRLSVTFFKEGLREMNPDAQNIADLTEYGEACANPPG